MRERGAGDRLSSKYRCRSPTLRRARIIEPKPSTVPMRVSDVIVGSRTPSRSRYFDCATFGNALGPQLERRVEDLGAELSRGATAATRRSRARGTACAARRTRRRREAAVAAHAAGDQRLGDRRRSRAARARSTSAADLPCARSVNARVTPWQPRRRHRAPAGPGPTRRDPAGGGERVRRLRLRGHVDGGHRRRLGRHQADRLPALRARRRRCTARCSSGCSTGRPSCSSRTSPTGLQAGGTTRALLAGRPRVTRRVPAAVAPRGPRTAVRRVRARLPRRRGRRGPRASSSRTSRRPCASGPRRRSSTTSSTRSSTGSTTAEPDATSRSSRSKPRRCAPLSPPGRRRSRVGRERGTRQLPKAGVVVRRRGARDARDSTSASCSAVMHRAQRRDRDLELVEIGLAGRELLQPQARAASAPAPTLAACSSPRAGSPRSSSPAITGISTMRDAITNQQVRPRDERVHEDRDDHHGQQEVGAAAHVRGRELLRGLGRELDVVLVRGDRLVLGAVVLEHAPDVA